MPANRGEGSPNWSPQADFQGFQRNIAPDDSILAYVPDSLEACAEYLHFAGYPDLDSYDEPHRRDLALFTAIELYEPGVPVVTLMEQHRAKEQAPHTRQDYVHERTLLIERLAQDITRKRAVQAGKVIEASQRFGICTRLIETTGELATDRVLFSPARRSFG